MAGGAKALDEAWLEKFFFQLREQGFAIDARHLTAAAKILGASVLEGVPPSRLQSRLCPIFARNPQDQARFKTLFMASLRELGIKEEASISGATSETNLRLREKWVALVSAVTGSVAVLIIGVGLYAVIVPSSTPPARPAIDIHGLPIETAPQITPPPPPERAPDFEVSEAVPTEPSNPKSVNLQIVDTSPAPPPWHALVAIAPLALIAGWFLWRWLSNRSWIGRRQGKPQQIRNHPAAGGLFAKRGFRRSAQEMRRHREEPTSRIDVPATVDATVEACGQFQLVMATRAATPEYLALIERFHREDHVTRLATAATDRLRAEGVAITDYFFGYAPQICRDATGRAVSIDKLTEAASDRRLVVVGTADGFFDPLTEEPEPWISKLAAWRDRTLFSARRIRHWGAGEAGLLDEGLNLATATPRGIAAYADLPADYTSEGSGALLEGRRVAPAAASAVEGNEIDVPAQPANLSREPRKMPRSIAALGAVGAIAASLAIAYIAAPGLFGMDAGEPLATVTPYSFSASKDRDGVITAKGYAPSTEARSSIFAALEADERPEPRIKVELALGAPVDGWGRGISEIINLLAPAPIWEMNVVDQEMQIVAELPDRRNASAVESEIRAVAESLDFAVQLDVLAPPENELTNIPHGEALWEQIIRTPAAQALSPFRIFEVLGPDVSRVFVGASGNSLSNEIEGFFTHDGYYLFFLPELTKAIEELQEKSSSLTDPEQFSQLKRETLAVYHSALGRSYYELLSGLSIKPFENLSDAIEITRLLSAPSSPIRRVLDATLNETNRGFIVGSDEFPSAAIENYNGLGIRQLRLGEAVAPRESLLGYPGETTSEQFVPLLDYVDGVDAPILQTLSILNEIYKHLNAVEALPLPAIEGSRLASLKENAQRAPEPVSEWLTQIHDQLFELARQSAPSADAQVRSPIVIGYGQAVSLPLVSFQEAAANGPAVLIKTSGLPRALDAQALSAIESPPGNVSLSGQSRTPGEYVLVVEATQADSVPTELRFDIEVLPETPQSELLALIRDLSGERCLFVRALDLDGDFPALEAYATNSGPLVEFDDAFRTTAGRAATIRGRSVTDDQCFLMDWLSQMGEPALGTQLDLQVDRDNLDLSEMLRGTVTNARDVQVFLVDAAGSVWPVPIESSADSDDGAFRTIVSVPGPVLLVAARSNAQSGSQSLRFEELLRAALYGQAEIAVGYAAVAQSLDVASSTRIDALIDDLNAQIGKIPPLTEGASADDRKSRIAALKELNRARFTLQQLRTEAAADEISGGASKVPTAAVNAEQRRVESVLAALGKKTAQTIDHEGSSAAARADFERFRDCLTCPDMIKLPGGTFIMGSPRDEKGRDADEDPQRTVTIAPFALAATEVTFDQWQACVDGGGCQNNPDPSDEGWGRGTRPVINVSWFDAQEYMAWLNAQVEGSDPYRLPTEAEWEFAARAGTTTPFAFGETISTDRANYNGEYTYGSGQSGVFRDQTVPVNDLDAANAWGLRHMHGNVWEWVEDCYHNTYQGAPTDGSARWSEQDGDCSSRVLRGGSWGFDPQVLRSADRIGYDPVDRNWVDGFRPARTILTP